MFWKKNTNVRAHQYGQLKRELAKFAPFSRRYLVLHDTTVDGEYGEALRLNIDTASLSQEVKNMNVSLCSFMVQ